MVVSLFLSIEVNNIGVNSQFVLQESLQEAGRQ